MTFQRIDLLPNFDNERRHALKERWGSNEAPDLEEKVLELIRAGGGEDFLQGEFEAGRLGFMEDQWDLRGLNLFREEIVFPDEDNFENINFAYAEFYHGTFMGACFPQTHFGFARFYNMEFRNCLFALANFYGAILEKCRFVDCDFVEYNGFSNCEFIDTVFENCFFDGNKFRDCKFNDSVVIRNKKSRNAFELLPKASRFSSLLEEPDISTVYQGMKDAYASGEVWKLVRRYRFLQNKFYTKHHLKGIEKIGGYFWQYCLDMD